MDNSDNILLMDMDGSLFNYDESLLEGLEQLRSPNEDKVVELHGHDSPPWLEARIALIKSVPGWWYNLNPIENGFKVYNEAKKIGFHCEILTKGPRTKPLAWTEKLQCCQNHLGYDIDVHVVSKKSRFYGKVLYDDFPEYMDQWLSKRPRGLGIMPVNENNKDYRHPNVVRWDGTNFEEVQRALKIAYNRKHGEPLVL